MLLRLTEESYCEVIGGTIATREAARDMKALGCRAVRVGVGCGSICSTRGTCGVGLPLAQSIIECKGVGLQVISDGGIKSAGDIVKALALGADACITGYLLRGTRETPNVEGKKVYRGMASKEAMQDKRREGKGYYKTSVAAEGVCVEVEERGNVEEVLGEVVKGIKQGFSLVGAKDIKDLQKKAEFVRVSPGSYQEGLTLKDRR